MRLIDADKLYRKFGVYTEKASMECAKARNENERKVWECIKEERSNAAKMIWNEPTVNQWIPVSERPPEVGQYVLISTDMNYVATATFKGDYWESTFDLDWEEVVAWRPTPKPFEVQENEKIVKEKEI